MADAHWLERLLKKKKEVELSTRTTMSLVRDVLKSIDGASQEAVKLSKEVEAFMSTMKVVSSSLGDVAKYTAAFTSSAAAIGMVANLVSTCQSIEQLKQISSHLGTISASLDAQTALLAPEKFAEKVYLFVRASVKDATPDDWYFVFHPDTDWHPYFEEKVRKEGPLGKNFCGISNELDALILYMLAVRQVREKKQQRTRQQLPIPVFHLLLPAYTPYVVPDPLIFPEGLHPFRMKGEIHRGRELVWLNLPGVDRKMLTHIGVFEPQTTFWEKLKVATGLTKPPEPRMLGTYNSTTAATAASVLENAEASARIRAVSESGSESTDGETSSSRRQALVLADGKSEKSSREVVHCRASTWDGSSRYSSSSSRSGSHRHSSGRRRRRTHAE
ncbi:hypothetical protein VTN77DRAFT_8484 [Rasamsonia byssochlamydoides]|uniref:uncharacterized protein n=1 Tax=Rasamsonia byssochlamydoides TaxID=89139 RepID=UPI003743743B